MLAYNLGETVAGAGAAELETQSITLTEPAHVTGPRHYRNALLTLAYWARIQLALVVAPTVGARTPIQNLPDDNVP
jgi:hypothetical protein